MSEIAKKRGKQHDVDWGSVEAEYITSNISVTALAKKIGVSYYTVREHAADGAWTEKRKAYQLDVTSTACEKVREDRAEKLAGMLRASDGLSDLITRTIDKINKLDRDMENPVDCKMIKDLTTATRDLTGVIRDLYNIPTDGERLARKIALERLELEKSRAETEDKNTEITVLFGDGKGHEEWAR